MTAVGWRVTPAARRAVMLPATLLALGVAAGRADLVLLAVPILIGTVLAVAWPAGSSALRPSAGALRLTAAAPALAEEGVGLPVEIGLGAPTGAELASITTPRGERVPTGAAYALRVGAGPRRLTVQARPAGWGRVCVARPEATAATADGLLAWGPVAGPVVSCTVLPAFDAIPPAPLPPRPAGLVGGHRTRRPGDGSDLLDVREFQPGDRLRRIDWRVSARRGQLYARRTAVDSDADVVLCLDTRLDVGHDGSGWASPTPMRGGARPDATSSLAVGVRATTSLAAAHVRHGDRVALVDLAQPRRYVRSGSGRRQLLRIRVHLATARAWPDAAHIAVRLEVVPTGAVVVVISPFLDESVADFAVTAHRRGGRVLAIDVLPEPVELDDERPWGAQAQQVVLAERAVRLRALAGAGVPVLRWDAAALGERLRRLARGRR